MKVKTKISTETKILFEKVVIHIHGGGFVAMSSESHEMYLRKFVKESKCVVFSIDYPLAPKAKFKQIVDSVFKSYLFIYSFLKNIIKVTNPEIVFVGDSAGGSLIASLTNWIIINDLYKP